MNNVFLFACEIVGIMCGLGVLFSRSIFNSAMLLLTTCLAVAGIFISLNSPYLFIAQIAIYSGGIVILVLFAVLIAGKTEASNKREWSIKGLLPPSLLFIYLINHLSFYKFSDTEFISQTSEQVGILLGEKYFLPFELSGVLLLVALIASIIISIQKPDQIEQ